MNRGCSEGRLQFVRNLRRGVRDLPFCRSQYSTGFVEFARRYYLRHFAKSYIFMITTTFGGKTYAQPPDAYLVDVVQPTVIPAEAVVVVDENLTLATTSQPNDPEIAHNEAEIVEGPSRIRKKGLTWPRYPSIFSYIGLFFGAAVTLAVFALTMYLFIILVVLDDDGKPKPFKGGCFDIADMRDHLCFFSAGQVAFGIICFGQVNIGLVSVGQVSIGLLFAVGQVAVGWCYNPIGQLAVSTYTHYAQVAFCLYDFDGAQIGFRTIKCFLSNEDGDQKPVKSC